MENKVDLTDLVIISREVYDRIIKCKNDYYYENIELKANMKVYEDYFYNNIFKGNLYYLNNIKEYTLDDYCIRSIITSIFEYGNIDINYIIQKIKEYKSRKESESDEAEK